IQGDEEAYYAGKAYDSKALREKLATIWIDDGIAYKTRRNKPLVNSRKWFNTTGAFAHGIGTFAKVWRANPSGWK
ncbi:MAG: hypothetical protein ACT4O2_12315, partial [Beijerinckiaceae bacterium]